MFLNSEVQFLKNLNLSDFFISKLTSELDVLIQVSLDEDLGNSGDVTSNATVDPQKVGAAEIIAKQDGIFAGSFVVRRVFNKVDPSIQLDMKSNEGDNITNKQNVISIFGSLKSILIGERTALNFLSRISGVATLTKQFTDCMKNSSTKILDTRKTIPGWRYLDKYSVVIGGGYNHRIGLFDMILIKENHIAASNGITNSVNKCRTYLNKNKLNLRIEVETRNLQEVKEAINCNVDRIMLDNMTIETIKDAVALVNKKVELEISGGITYNNLKDYLSTGVDYISVGQLTHSASAFDYSLLIIE
jgi:nicotinate-nucleotide pyrophosphorylase (carboxylating)